jgi:CRP-like cAMP-binding protein
MRSDRLARAFETERVYEDGELIVAEGDDGHEMFVIRDGEVVISRRNGRREHVLATLGRGEMFGEMSLLESRPREADARARGRVTLLVLGPGALLVRLRRDPSFAVELLHHMSRRIRTLNERLADAIRGDTASGPEP